MSVKSSMKGCEDVRVGLRDGLARTSRSTFALTFLGTRGGIDVSSRSHRRHSSLLVTLGRQRLMIDCGADWLHRFEVFRPTAILVTHGHPDHAGGLAEGAPCPVYATRRSWAGMLGRFPLDRRAIVPGEPIRLGGLRIEAFAVRHSIIEPAVGYRISAHGSSFFYVPDVAAIPRRSRALGGVQLYIGDGATFKRSLLRRRGRTMIGHISISEQIRWCGKAQIRCAIFTHCGSQIVRADSSEMQAAIRELGYGDGVNAAIAHDGLRILLRRDGHHRVRK